MYSSINDFLPDRSAPQELSVAQGIDLEAESMLIGLAELKACLKPRKLFSHKGTYGHALIIAGAPATMGAAILSAMACLHGGAGLTTLCIPESGLQALNTALPEVMYVARETLLGQSALETYSAIAIGPGLRQGTGFSDADFKLMRLVLQCGRPVVADADALNLFAEQKQYLSLLPENSILTPHVKEFDRLFGEHESWWARVQTARQYAKTQKVIVLLKNQYTFIADQEGKVFINTTGNPAMAQGGMGDVLTGLITAFVAQGYPSKEAAILACGLHGMAGDDLAHESFNVTASAVAMQVPRSRYRLQSFAP